MTLVFGNGLWGLRGTNGKWFIGFSLPAPLEQERERAAQIVDDLAYMFEQGKREATPGGALHIVARKIRLGKNPRYYAAGRGMGVTPDEDM
jgi:hypothetical protein